METKQSSKKAKDYTHLTREERHYLEQQRKAKVSLSQIAKDLGRHRSSLGREVNRNSQAEGDYAYQQADSRAKHRHKIKPKAKKLSGELLKEVIDYLKHCWSPEQISGRLKHQQRERVSHETIYRYVYTDKKAGGYLHGYLRCQAKAYKKRGKTDYRGSIPHRTDIAERPAIVDAKSRLGDWEADTIIGKGHQGVLVTLTERVSKLNLAIAVPRKEALLVKDAIIAALKPFKDWVHTITFDNGCEFCQHLEIAKAIDCKTYFAKPYCSWQRGLNENHNGLLRQYFVKESPLNTVTQQQVNEAISELNNRPRKMLGYRTPWEVFEQMSSINEAYFSDVALIT
jgi:transposase, IS30 family